MSSASLTNNAVLLRRRTNVSRPDSPSNSVSQTICNLVKKIDFDGVFDSSLNFLHSTIFSILPQKEPASVMEPIFKTYAIVADLSLVNLAYQTFSKVSSNRGLLDIYDADKNYIPIEDERTLAQKLKTTAYQITISMVLTTLVNIAVFEPEATKEILPPYIIFGNVLSAKVALHLLEVVHAYKSSDTKLILRHAVAVAKDAFAIAAINPFDYGGGLNPKSSNSLYYGFGYATAFFALAEIVLYYYSRPPAPVVQNSVNENSIL